MLDRVDSEPTIHLLCGLVAVASVFSFAVRANVSNRQMAIATTLVYDKMEQFRSAPLTDPVWTTAAGSETVAIGGEPYIRKWKTDSSVPRMVTVIVYTPTNGLSRRQTELVRATTLVAPVF